MRFIYSSQLLVSRETLGLSRILMFLMSERVFVLIGIWFFILALLYLKYSLFYVKQKRKALIYAFPVNRLRSPIS